MFGLPVLAGPPARRGFLLDMGLRFMDYLVPWVRGKTVKIRRGPAAVTGDESQECHCPDGWEGW